GYPSVRRARDPGDRYRSAACGLLAPYQEIVEQLIALLLGRWELAGAPRDKLIELPSHSRQGLLAIARQQLLGTFEALPARQGGGEIGLAPIGVAWRLLQFCEFREESFDELVDPPIAIAVLGPVVGKQNAAGCNCVDGFTRGYEIGIVLVRQG